MRLGYTLSLSSSYLTLGRDTPTYDVRSGGCVILVLGGLLPVIFTTAVCVPRVSRMRSTGVQGILRAV